uniref:Uncharacterized protein n=1 Tax=Moniliophthora roreri TaxID=221103 RepID=A0A0W0FBN2_MONRR
MEESVLKNVDSSS